MTDNDERVTTRWGISFSPEDEPYETYDTYEKALDAFKGMKLKHQYGEYIVRVDTTITTVYDGSEHVSWDDAYGDNSAKAGIIELVRMLNQQGADDDGRGDGGRR